MAHPLQLPLPMKHSLLLVVLLANCGRHVSMPGGTSEPDPEATASQTPRPEDATPGSGAPPTPIPEGGVPAVTGPAGILGYAALDLDVFEAELNDALASVAAGVGTECRPAFPVLPVEPLEEVSVASGAQLAAAAASGHKRITLTADIQERVGVLGSDIELRLNGHFVAQIDVSFDSGTSSAAAHRLRVLGPGRLGALHSPGFQAAKPSDLIIDGVRISPDFKAVPESIVAVNFPGVSSVQRIAFLNTVVRGYSGAGNSTAAFLVGGDDVIVANTNFAAGQQSILNNDDWGFRAAGGHRYLIADSFGQSKWKPVVRQGHVVTCEVLYSTPRARDTDRRMTLLNLWNGSLEASVPAGNTIDTDRIVRLHTRWVADRSSGIVGNTQWGPSGAPGMKDRLFLIGDTDVRVTSNVSTYFGADRFALREQFADPDEVWNFSVQPNTFTWSNDLADLVPPWPVVTSETTGEDVGHDPYSD